MFIGYRVAASACFLALLLASQTLRAEKSVHKLKKKLRHTEHNAGKTLSKMGQVVGAGLVMLLPDSESENNESDDCPSISLSLTISKNQPQPVLHHPPAKHPVPAHHPK
jgi:hypothetical protein